jgi:DNA polymerase-3 subunit alpha
MLKNKKQAIEGGLSFSNGDWTITRMAKMPLIADPRYSMEEDKSREMERNLRENVSMTNREPYPQEHEIG